MKETLDKYVAEGWLISQRHPTLPLTIYNYSQATQFEKHWDEITLMCRGLVVDDKGVIVARPFKKFFNWEEIIHSVDPEQLKMDFEVFDKMDGSLGIGFFYEGEFVMASRGSFTSEQARKANAIRCAKYDFRNLNKNLTYLFEILYPSNRIVVNYGDIEELILIGLIHTKTGDELNYELTFEIFCLNTGCPVVHKYDGVKDFEAIKALNIENKEGFVIRFSNGYRMKIKFDEYVALHRIMTNCSSYDVWENLMMFNKLPEELLQKVPDEFYSWMKELETDLRAKFREIEYEALKDFVDIVRTVPEWNRKEFALLAIKKKNSGILFSMLNGKPYSEAIWKLIKPPYEKPFAKND
jgi:RNA ligase